MSGRPLFPPVFSPTESHALVDDFTLRAARMRARQQPPGVSQVYPVPLRNHALWSGNNELGRQAPFAPDANNRQMILKLDEYGEPTDWTIALGMQYAETILGGFDVTAEISFGIGGTTQTIEVDWRDGTILTLPCNAATVVAVYNLQDTESPPDVPDDLILRVTMARRSSGRRDATRSFSYALGTNGDELAIPFFAKDLLVLPIGSYNATFFQDTAIEFLTGTGVGAVLLNDLSLMHELTYFDPVTPVYGAFVPIPIPPFARYLRTVTAGGVPKNLQCSLRYGLSV